MSSLPSSRTIISFCCCFLLGIGLSVSKAHIGFPEAIALNPPSDKITLDRTLSPEALETLAKQAYSVNNYDRALSLWQQAFNIYRQNGDILSQARVTSHLALVNYRYGYTTKARTAIQRSVELLEASPKSSERNLISARVYNNQGVIELGFGNTEKAIASWDLAVSAYQRVNDDLGVVRARLNQIKALKNLGFLARATELALQASEILENKPDSVLKAIALRNYGELLRYTGDIKRSQTVLEDSLEIASRFSSLVEEVKIRLALGKTLMAGKETADKSTARFASKSAAVQYRRAMQLCQSDVVCANSDLPLQINLAQFNLRLRTKSWHKALKLARAIERQFVSFPADRNCVDLKLSFAYDLVTLHQNKISSGYLFSNIPSWTEIASLVEQATTEAQQLQYAKAESYGWGLQGRVGELLKDWDRADRLTIEALTIAETLNAPEIAYLWQWQLGRINRARGNRENAISNYQQALTLSNSLSREIANLNHSVQYSFRDRVEPVYREAVALLLEASPGETVSQENLIKARETIESLQIAELNNFFREACLTEKPVSIDSVDDRAAAIYPIILSDRLVTIVSLPHKPLTYYSIPITQTKLEATIKQLRQTVVVRSRRSFYQPATELYQWLIEPIEGLLAQSNIETLVFVPDGAWRNVPFAALYDGNSYLIEKYNLVLNPGLQLLSPRSLQETKLKTIAVGLTEERDNFAALEYVRLELAKIQKQVKSSILINEEFTAEALEEEIKYSDYPIVHIATHGQFSSSLDNTFLLAWDRRINIKQLNQILQTRTEARREPIELLILSACETAAGDRRAALGLAGMAIQAGAKSTIATLWSINDRATAELMNVLYREMSTKSLDKVKAIRQAQLSLLNEPQYKHPFYWAAYTTIGNWL